MNNEFKEKKEETETKIKELMDFGFDKTQCKKALKKHGFDTHSALNYLLSTSKEHDSDLYFAIEESLKTSNLSNVSHQDHELSEALHLSLKESGQSFIKDDPSNPENYLRKEGSPVGLKNIGNTCYFNSLLQFYFMIPKLTLEILNFDPEKPENDPQSTNFSSHPSINLVENMQKLLSCMIYSNKKFADPSKLLYSLVDNQGNQIRVGDQRDIGEFHMILVGLIEEGLKFHKKHSNGELNEMDPEESKNVGSLISELFYAKQIEYLRFPTTGEEIVNEVTFGQILLNIEEKDLYSAWDANYHSEIEDYFINNTNIHTVQETWPISFPSILLFQIQRVKYDTASENSIKSNKAFHFPLEIYTDRFLLKNRKRANRIRKKMLKLKEEKRKIEKNLETFENYQGSGKNIKTILKVTQEFLEIQKNLKSLAKDHEGSFENELRIEVKNEKNLKKSIKSLKNYQKHVKKKMKEMHSQLSTINEEIEELYSSSKLRKNKYILYGLLIHDGFAGSGHYYSFIYDIEYEKWRKYSDLNITEVSFEEVLKDAIGGNGSTSAYCLIYVKQSILIKENKPFWSFNTDNMQNCIYYENIPKKIIEEINHDNLILNIEIQDYKANETFKNIRKEFKEKIKINKNIYTESKKSSLNDSKGTELINFGYYLLIRNSKSFYKKFLFNQTIEEITGKRIEKMHVTDPLYEKIQNYYSDVYNYTKTDEETIETEKKNFYSNYLNAQIGLLIVEFFSLHKFTKVFRVIVFHNEFQCNPNLKTHKFITDCIKAFVLRLSSLIFIEISNQNNKIVIKLASLLAHIIVNILNPEEYIEKVAITRLKNAKIFFEEKNNENGRSYLKKFNEILKNITNGSAIANIDFEKFLPEIEEIRQKIKDFTGFEVNSMNNIGNRYYVMRKTLKGSVIDDWIKLANKIQNSKNWDPENFLKIEKKQGMIQ